MSKKKKKVIQSSIPTVKLSTQERHKRVWEALFYSHQRIDALLIAIASAGIYACLETIKYYDAKSETVHVLIKISAGILLVAIIANFFSQWCSSKIHYNDYCISSIEIQCEEEKRERNDFQQEIQKHECKIHAFEKAEKFLTIFSIILMSLGLGGIMVFFIFIF